MPPSFRDEQHISFGESDLENTSAKDNDCIVIDRFSTIVVAFLMILVLELCNTGMKIPYRQFRVVGRGEVSWIS